MAPAAGATTRLAVRVWPAVRWLWRGLAGVVCGRDPAPVWRSPWRRRAVYGGLAGATVLLCGLSLVSIRGVLARTVFLGPVQPQAVHRGVKQVTGLGSGWLLPARPISMITLEVLVSLAVLVPLALAGRYPLLGWRLGWAGLWLIPSLGIGWRWGWSWGPALLAGVVIAFAVAGVRQSRAVLCWMWALTLPPWLWRVGTGGVGVAGCLGLAAVAVAADAMAARRRAQLIAAGQAERAELEQARRAVLEERARIARELHDVVAHHLSLIAVRAESAPFRLPGLAAPVSTEFGSLSAAAREALADMRRLLGVLRAEQPAARAPQPQLADLPDLVAAARRAGVTVALHGPADWAPVPAGVGVCAYRIVQESLSNASRHAPGAAVTVTVGHDGRAVCLNVTNGPAGHAAGDHRPGHGLAGMRERVALLGGSLTAGPAPGGGFTVCATLPLSDAA